MTLVARIFTQFEYFVGDLDGVLTAVVRIFVRIGNLLLHGANFGPHIFAVRIACHRIDALIGFVVSPFRRRPNFVTRRGATLWLPRRFTTFLLQICLVQMGHRL